MTATELRRHWHESPFVPFKIIVPRRKPIRVPHPDFLWIVPGGRIAHVCTSDKDWASLDIFLITVVEQNTRNGSARRTRRSKK